MAKGFGDNDANWYWLAFVNAYTGRAARGVFRNEKQGEQYRVNMLKAAGLILSAVEALDKKNEQTA